MTASAPVIRTPHVLGALATIALLAFALPFAAVRTLHARRLAAADSEIRAIVQDLRVALGRVPPTVSVLTGPGDMPRTTDSRWAAGTSLPLASVVRLPQVDPWGNTYLVNFGAARTGGAIWVLSAGPDGVIDTPFDVPLPHASVRGDDVAVPLN
jgi:hypothetical protein